MGKYRAQAPSLAEGEATPDLVDQTGRQLVALPVSPTVQIDFSVSMPAAARLIAPVDPDRESITLTNASDAAMQVATIPVVLDGTVKPGALALAPGASLRLDGAGQVFAWCGTAGKALTAVAVRRLRASRRTIAASANVGMPVIAATAGTVGNNVFAQTFFADFWVRGDADVTDLELVYLGWGYTQVAGNAETDAATAPTIAASIEYPAGSGMLYPLSFAGAVSTVLPIGGQIVTDALPVTLRRGAKFTVRTFIDLGATTNSFLWQFSSESVPGRPRAVTGDATMLAAQVGNYCGFHIAPSLILGTANIDAPRAVAAEIDSINHGTSEPAAPDARNNMGWLPRLLDRVLGVPYVKIGRGGLSTAHIVGAAGGSSDAATIRVRRFMALLRATHAIDTLGTNDIVGGTSIALTMLAKGKLARLSAGMTWAVAKLLPRTTSTNGWATPEGQVTISTNLAAFNALLDGLPDLIVVDPNVPAVVFAGAWTAGSTTDGVHPSPIGAERLATDGTLAKRVQAWLARMPA